VIYCLLFAQLTAVPDLPQPDVSAVDAVRYGHRFVERLDRRVGLVASGRHLLVRPARPIDRAALKSAVEGLGLAINEVVITPAAEGLLELDLGASVARESLLSFARTLLSTSLISAHFPVWLRGDGRAHVDEWVIVALHRPARASPLWMGTLVSDPKPLFGLPHLVAVRARSGDPIATAAVVQNHPAVRWAEPHWFFYPKPFFTPEDDLFADTWHLREAEVGSIHTEAAWDHGLGAGVRVGVIDTGTDIAHADLNVIASFDVIDDDRDASAECSSSHDGRGRADGCPNDRRFMESHGTGVSGVIGALANGVGAVGVCPQCELLPVRMIGGSGGRRSSHAAALTWLAQQRAAVVNNSWGPSLARFFPMSIAEQEALEALALDSRDGLGATLLYAAGNDNLRHAGYNSYLRHRETVAVSASTQRDDLACYSNIGEMIDFAAPSRGCFDGENGLVTTDVTGPNGYHESDYHTGFGGTSGATPVASGVAALVVAANPQLSARQVRQVMAATADPIRADSNDWLNRIGRDLEAEFEYDENGHSIGFGFGRVNAQAAVLGAAEHRQGGACDADCARCDDEGRCHLPCLADLDCPGRTRCVEKDGVFACQEVQRPVGSVGDLCEVGCVDCLLTMTTSGRGLNICTAPCTLESDCPKGFICASRPTLGKVCVPGFEGCGNTWGEGRCEGGVRVLGASTAYCGCPCFRGEDGGEGAYCPDGFSCAEARCRCTRREGGGCLERTCDPNPDDANFYDVCFPQEGALNPCSEDADCAGVSICVQGMCRDNPAACLPCSACERHDDCGAGGWCAGRSGGQARCLVPCAEDDRCPGDSVCRSIDQGSGPRYCLNPQVEEGVCPEDYSCALDSRPRCVRDADCPSEHLVCAPWGECVDPNHAADAGPPPMLPDAGARAASDAGAVEPGNPTSCGCDSGRDSVGLFVLALLALRRRRSISDLRPPPAC
jgi:subtilisin family serine protease